MLTTANFVVRLSATSTTGETLTEEMDWDTSWNWDQVFDAAHHNADGSLPTIAQCEKAINENDDSAGHSRDWCRAHAAVLWSAARSLRQLEDRLKERCGL